MRDTWNPKPTILHACTSLKEHYGLIHLKELALKPGFHAHIELVAHDQGNTPWDYVLENCRAHIPPESWVMIEHIPSLEDGRRTIPAILKLADA